MVGSIWTQDPYIMSARHMVGSVFTKDAQALPTAKGSAAMLALINANVITPFTAANLTIGQPQASTQNNCNTVVQITAQPASGYSGSMNLYYNRRNIQDAVTSTSWLLGTISAATTVQALLSQINTAYGTNFDPTDVVNGTVNAGATSIMLVAASTSYVFVPGTVVYLTNSVSLQLATPSTVLPGFNNAAGVGPAPNYTSVLMHFNSPTGLGIITDDYNHQVTQGSAVQLSYTQSRFGNSSLVGTVANNQWVSLADTPDIRLGGDFTVEFWMYSNALTYDVSIYSKGLTGNVNMGWIEINNGAFQVKPDGAASATVVASAAASGLVAGAWQHLAVTKQGTLWTCWVNGQPVGSFTSSAGLGNLPGAAYIGGNAIGSPSFNGFLDEFRITNGLARYTTAFTPPTAPFSNTTSAVLLMHCDSVSSGALVDSAGTHTPTLVGNAAFVSSGAFGSSGSIQFANDAVSAIKLPDAPEFHFMEDFCIEAMFYPTTTAVNQILFGKGTKAAVWFASGGRFQLTLDGASTATINVTPTLTLNAWHHIALTRQLNTYYLWLDGVVIGSYAANSALTFGYNTNNLYFGNALDQSGWGVTNTGLVGQMDEIRVTTGDCRYTNNFRPAQVPFVKDYARGNLANVFPANPAMAVENVEYAFNTWSLIPQIAAYFNIDLQRTDLVNTVVPAGALSVALTVATTSMNYTPGSTVILSLLGTSMLLHFDGVSGATTTTDATGQNLPVLTNGPVISNNAAKIGPTSVNINGAAAGGVVTVLDAPWLRGTGDITYECWVQQVTTGGTQELICKDSGGNPAARLAMVTGAWELWLDSTSSTPDLNVTPSAFAANTWYHIALVSYQGTWYLYQNGVLLGTVVGPRTFGNNNSPLTIGNYNGGSSRWVGYIDEFRVSTFARYTTNFAPPVQAFVVPEQTIQLPSVFSTTAVAMPAGTALGATTIRACVLGIAASCGVNLVPADVVDGSITLGASGSITLVAAATSRTYVPGSTVTVTYTMPSAVMLLHFDGTSGATTTVDAAGHPMTMYASQLSNAGGVVFGPTAYHGQSTSGYVSTPDAPELEFNGDFTMECFYTPSATDLTGEIQLFSKGVGSYLDLYKNAWYVSMGSTNVHAINGVGGGLIAGNTYHVAFTKQGQNLTVWVNGVAAATGTSSLPFGANATPFMVGNYNYSGALGTTGYIDEVRITNGIALYTGTFSPPQQPFVLPLQSVQLASAFPTNFSMPGPGAATTIQNYLNLIANAAAVNLLPIDVNDGPIPAGASSVTLTAASTSRTYVPGSQVTFNMAAQGTVLLAHFDSSPPTDVTGNSVLTLGSTGSIDTASSKFGGASLKCSAAAYVAALTWPDGPFMKFPPGQDFTVEFWAQPANASQNAFVMGKANGPAGIFQYLNGSWYVYPGTTLSTAYILSGAGASGAVWQHVALVRQGTTWSLYINGTLAQSVTSTSGFATEPGPWMIGESQASTYIFSGHMDELRISSVARYTGNFTPLAVPFLPDAQMNIGSLFTTNTIPPGQLGLTSSSVSITTVLPQISAWFGVPLFASDVVAQQVSSANTSITLTIASTSVNYVPGSTVTFAVQSNDALLMHFDGTTPAAVAVDSVGHPFTVAGVAGTHSTDTAKFGQSFWCNAAGAYISTPNASDLQFAGDFTLEAWCYNASNGSLGYLISKGPSAGGFAAVTLQNSVIKVNSDQTMGLLTASIPAGWNSWAVTRKGNTWTIYMNGAVVQSVTATDTFGVNTNPLVIGNTGAGNNPAVAYQDEMRFSKLARYTAAYSVATAPFTLD
jgi:hypothetical protein